MSSRRRLLLCGLPATAVVVALVLWLLWPRTAITPENAAKIRAGMTLAEVEAILGGPPRTEATGRLAAAETLPNHDGSPDLAFAERRVWLFQNPGAVPERRAVWREPEHRLGEWTHQWVSDVVIVRVDFDSNERVISFRTLPVRRIRDDPADLIRRWLGF
jgi:hypothetical protein